MNFSYVYIDLTDNNRNCGYDYTDFKDNDAAHPSVYCDRGSRYTQFSCAPPWLDLIMVNAASFSNGFHVKEQFLSICDLEQADEL